MILEERGTLKENLQWGDLTRIAKAAGVHYTTVLAWFSGNTDNKRIEVCAKALAEKRQKETKQLVKQFD